MSGQGLGSGYLPGGTRARFVLTEEAIEVDEVEGVEVTRRRVLLDDVLAVTLHRQRQVGLLVATGLIALAAAGLALALLLDGPGTPAAPAAVIFGMFGLPALVVFVVHLAVGVQHVSVYGRRSRARVSFLLRHGRARELRDLICRAVRDRQSRS